MEHNLINEVAICIVVAWVLAIAAQILKQPLILAYLAGGFLVGPVGLGWIQDLKSIETVAEIGLILLLFMIGLEIDLKKILSAGRLIFFAALAQMGCGCLAGLLLFRLLGFPFGGGKLDALYLAVAAALSSTVIIVKLLYEKRELDTFAGRLTLGILVLQDLFAILFLAIQPNLDHASAWVILLSLAKVGLLVAGALLASRFVLPHLFRAVARLPELVVVGALSWCFLVAGAASQLSLSREMGALIAGVAISTFPYTLDVAAKVTSLRDFFVTLFFVALGMEIPAPTFQQLEWGLLIAVFVFLSRVLTIFPVLYKTGQGLRASIVPAINLSQISELSLVLVALGAGLGHLSDNTRGVLAYAFVFLAVGSSYAIARSDALLPVLISRLQRWGFRDLSEGDEPGEAALRGEAIYLLGFSWTASSLIEELQRHAPDLLRDIVVVDFNPNVHRELKARGISVIYGDITQRDTLQHAGVGSADMIVCSLSNTVLKGSNNLRLLQQLRELNSKARIVMHAELFGDVPKLYAAGADYVSVPRLVEAQDLCEVLAAVREGRLAQKRRELDLELAHRREVIP